MKLLPGLPCLIALLRLVFAALLRKRIRANRFRIIVPYSAGGGTDIVARARSGQKIEAKPGRQSVIVDNRGRRERA